MATNKVYKPNGTWANTTDNTETTIASFATRTDKVYHVEAVVLAQKTTDASQVASYKRTGTFKNDGGTLTAIGSVTSDHTAEDDSGWDCTLDADGTTIRVRGTGNTGDAVSWNTFLTVYESGKWIANYGIVEG